MTTHLLDTNAWLWQVSEPEKLNRSVRATLGAPEVMPLAVSAISVWEIALKVRKGKLNLSLPLDDWFAIALLPAFVTVLPIDANVAREAQRLPGLLHEDPADRIIVATALVHNLALVTSDRRLLAYSHVRSLDTR